MTFANPSSWSSAGSGPDFFTESNSELPTLSSGASLGQVSDFPFGFNPGLASGADSDSRWGSDSGSPMESGSPESISASLCNLALCRDAYSLYLVIDLVIMLLSTGTPSIEASSPLFGVATSSSGEGSWSGGGCPSVPSCSISLKLSETVQKKQSQFFCHCRRVVDYD